MGTSQLRPSSGRQPEGGQEHRPRRSQQTSDAASSSDASSSSQQQQQTQTKTAQTPPAQVLTRSALPSLSTLDAGDVIECYALFRRAKLTPTEPTPISPGGGDGRMIDEDADSGGSSGSNNGNNGNGNKANKQPHSSGPHGDSLVRIQKSALAFRYRPPSWSALDQDADVPVPDSGYARRRTYELTLEYGPSRRGSGLDQESVPVVVGGPGGGALPGGDNGGVSYPGDGYAHVATTTTDADPGYGHGDDDGGDGGQPQQQTTETLYPDERYVTWDNEARVYYRTDIAAEEWVEAYYVAPISGAVLGKVLDYAVEYAERHRRYQPFEVAAIGGDEEEDNDNEGDGDNSNCDFGASCERKSSGPSPDHPRTILRSSSADDFVWSVFDALASMYVDIRPILAPPRERVRFLVRDGRDVTRLSGLVRGEDLALPGVPVDAPAAGDGGDDDGGADTNNNSGHGGGREDEGEEGTAVLPVGGGPPSRTVASLAADFYSRFYDCANAIRTGDYSRWEEREPAQTQTQRPPPTVEPTDASPIGTDGNNKKKNDNKTKKAALHDPAKDVDATADDDAIVNGNEDDNDDDDDGFEFDDGEEDEPPHRRFLKQGKKDKGNSTATAQIPTPTAKAAAVTASEPEPEPGLAEFEFQEAIAAKEEGDAGESDSTSADADNDEADDQQGSQEQIDEASAAEQAAMEALDKANDAAAAISSNADDDEAMAEAAQEAATAAKKAAEASSLAKAAAAMDALFSVDGGQMTQILGTCLSDPKYEIRVDRKVALPSVDPDNDRQMEDGATTEHRYATLSTTHVYLYIDGTSYYRLNLTPPFWDASPAIQAMPQPKVYEEGRAQFLDSLFFFGIIGAFVFGMVVLLHNIGVLRIDPRLKFKSFFHPAHPGPAGGAKGGYMNATELRESGGYRDESEVDSDSCFTDEASDADLKDVPDEARPTRGGGQAHPFRNPGAIPSIFMGKSSSSQNLRVGDNAPADSSEGDLELSDMKGGDKRQGDESRRSSSNRTGSDLDFDKSGDMSSRVDTMKAAMNDAEGGMRRTPIVRGRSKSFRRDDPNRSVHSTSSSSNRRRRSPVDTLPLPAQVRANRDPELVDLPGLKSLTPVAVPEGAMRQSSRASTSNGKRSLNGELQQEAAGDITTENGAADGATPLAIV